MTPPFLSATDVNAYVSMSDVVEALRSAFIERHDDPPRSITSLGTGDSGENVMLTMPSRWGHVGGAKLISLFPGNVAAGQPAIQGVYVLFSGIDGRIRAVIDGAVLTTLRTPAASALATDYLADASASVLSVIGSGTQAEGHVRAMLTVRPTISELRVASATPGRAQAFASEMAKMFGLHARAVALEDASDADIVCVCTTAERIVLHRACAGSHINAIGAFKPHQQELTPELVGALDVWVDHRTAAAEEAGDLIQAVDAGTWQWSDVQGDLCDLVRSPPERSADSVTLFKSVGLGIEDLVLAQLAADRAGIEP